MSEAEGFNLAIPGKNNRTFGTLFDDKAKEAEVKKGTDTGEKVLERRRREFEELSIQLDACKNQFLNADAEKITPEQAKQIILTQLVVGIPAIITGLGLIVDCVSCQEIRKLKGGKRGAARITAGRSVYDIAAFMAGLYGQPDENGKIPNDEKGVLDIMGDDVSGRLDFMIQQLYSIATMVHMQGKHEDPRMFAGTIEDPKTGTKTEVDDLFDAKIGEQFEAAEIVGGAKPAEKEYDDDAALTDEEAEKIKATKTKITLEGIL